MVFRDTLFIGDAGRTDLYGPEEVQGWQQTYDSIFNKILPLERSNTVPCARRRLDLWSAIAKRDYSTLGLERLQNPLLQKTEKEEFIKFKLKRS